MLTMLRSLPLLPNLPVEKSATVAKNCNLYCSSAVRILEKKKKKYPGDTKQIHLNYVVWYLNYVLMQQCLVFQSCWSNFGVF